MTDPEQKKSKFWLFFWIFGVLGIGIALFVASQIMGSTTDSSDGEAKTGPNGTPANVTTLDVSLTVFNDDGCDLGLGYDDVPGSTVTVRVDGIPVAFEDLPYFGDDGVAYCDFEVSIPGVPTDGNIYEIEIGRRGNAVMSRAELVADNWSYAASLGL